jgi:hypothetical protein
MPTESLTLAKALSVKNRLAGRLAQSRALVESYNSVVAGQSGSRPDVRAELERYRALQGALVTVKATLHRANLPIYEEIVRLAEVKATIQMLSGLNTKDGSEPGYNGVEFVYEATVKKPEVLQMVRRLEAEVDSIQDRINQFNAATRIELPVEVLDLAR